MIAMRLGLASVLLTAIPHACHPKLMESNCAPGHAWVGDRCLATDCTSARTDAFCLMDDGSAGNCLGGVCQTVDLSSNDNCGQYGIVCPKGEACENIYGYQYCGTAAGISYVCDATTVCPDGFKCSSGECVHKACNSDDQGEPCTFSTSGYEQIGVCCDTSCLAVTGDSPANYAPFDDHHCGGCGIDCGDDARCVPSYSTTTGYIYSCVPSDCPKHHDGAICSLPDAGIYYVQTGTCCDGKCSNLQQNDNCGVCGEACPNGLSCYYGYCATETNGQITDCTTAPCPNGWSCLYGYYCVPNDCSKEPDSALCTTDGVNAGACCDGSCSNLYSTDSQNCGACGNACPDGTRCNYGTCVAVVDCSKNADGTYCDANGTFGTCCEGSCKAYGTCGTATSTNPNGYCAQDSDCPTGYGCVYGTCYQQTCPTNFDNGPCAFAGATGSTYGLCCSGTCTDVYNDSNNCGGCGSTCSGQTTCQYGGCYGPNLAYVQCPADGSGCPSGEACSGYGSVCRPTSCKGLDDGITCAYGIEARQGLDGICCAGQCVLTTANPNCGACGASCGTDQCVYSYCSSTSCKPECAEGQVCANGACVGSVCDPVLVSYLGPPACAADDGTVGTCCGGGACEETQSDPQNCGGCGVKCPEGQTCSKGACSGVGKNCAPDRLYAYCDLSGGSLSKVCCPGIGCTDTASDTENCGSCGVVCADGQICSAGVCAVPGGAGGTQP